MDKYYNDMKFTNKNKVDVWIQLSSHINWIKKIAFRQNKEYNCFRKLDKVSAPKRIEKETEVEKCNNVFPSVVDHRGIGF